MFYHAFNGYMDHAFPLDELRPHSCGGEDSLGGYALTLVIQIMNPHFQFSSFSIFLLYYSDFLFNVCILILKLCAMRLSFHCHRLML